jgi:hypothetical protein
LGDHAPEVLVVNQAGQFFCLDGRTGESLWKRTLPARIQWGTTAIVAADLDGDGQNEIVVGDRGGHVECLTGAGEVVWRHAGDHGTVLCPAVADVFGDGNLEVLVAGSKLPLVCLSNEGKELWRLKEQGAGCSPVIADLDGDRHAEIVAAVGRRIVALSGTGRVLWHYVVDGEVDAGICAADADRDGLPEIYIADLEGHLTALSPNGQLRWRAELGLRIRRAPSVADVDGDGNVEIIVAGYGAELILLDPQGARKSLTKLPAATNATPTVVQLGEPPRPAVVVPTISGTTIAYQWPAARPDGLTLWSEYRFGATRHAALVASGPRSRAAFKSVDFGPFYVGANPLRVALTNPDRETLEVTLEAFRSGRRPQSRKVTSADALVEAALVYQVPARSSTDVTLSCTVAKEGQVIAQRRRTVTVVPFRKELADLEALAHQLRQSATQLPTSLGLIGRAVRIEAQLPDFRRRSLVTGTLSDVDRRQLRDEISALLDDAHHWLPIVRRGVQAARDGSGPLVLSAANPWAPFGGLDEIVEGRLRSSAMQIVAFGGETESVALNVFNLDSPLLSVRVEIDPLVDAAGAKRPARGTITLRETTSVPTQTQDLAADALPQLNQANVLLLPGWEARQLWLQVNTQDLPAGTWQTHVRLRTLEPASREFSAALTIRVSPVQLPEEQPLRQCNWGYVHSSRLKDQPEAALRDMVEHGTNVFVTSFVPHAKYSDQGDLVGAIDYATHDQFVRRHAPHGIILFQHTGFLTGPGGQESDAYARAHSTLMQDWVRHLREMGVGYDGFALYPVDEPGLRDGLVERYLLYAKLARRADPKIQMYTDPVSRITMEELREMLPYVDIWCPNRSAFLLDVGQDKMDLMKSSGKTIWNYECLGNAKHRSPLGYYRAQAWLAWHHGLTGIGFWSYCTSSADPWYVPGDTQDYLMIYQGEGVVPSKRWEAVRDGVEDYCMLWALRRAARNGSAEAQREAAELLGPQSSAVAQFCGIDSAGTVPGRDGLAGVRRVADRRWQRIEASRLALMELLEELQPGAGQ